MHSSDTPHGFKFGQNGPHGIASTRQEILPTTHRQNEAGENIPNPQSHTSSFCWQDYKRYPISGASVLASDLDGRRWSRTTIMTYYDARRPTRAVVELPLQRSETTEESAITTTNFFCFHTPTEEYPGVAPATPVSAVEGISQQNGWSVDHPALGGWLLPPTPPLHHRGVVVSVCDRATTPPWCSGWVTPLPRGWS